MKRLLIGTLIIGMSLSVTGCTKVDFIKEGKSKTFTGGSAYTLMDSKSPKTLGTYEKENKVVLVEGIVSQFSSKDFENMDIRVQTLEGRYKASVKEDKLVYIGNAPTETNPITGIVNIVKEDIDINKDDYVKGDDGLYCYIYESNPNLREIHLTDAEGRIRYLENILGGYKLTEETPIELKLSVFEEVELISNGE